MKAQASLRKGADPLEPLLYATQSSTDPELGGQGVRTHLWKIAIQVWIPLNQASIQCCRAIIGPPAKRRLKIRFKRILILSPLLN